MRILLTGGTGFIGSRLRARLEGRHAVRIVSRGSGGDVTWEPAALRAAVAESDAVVHLAGENLIARRWTPGQKARLRASRIDTTRQLAEAVADTKPRVFVTASAIGYYGASPDRRFVAGDGPGDDFLARLCADWEAARQPALDAGVRTATVRIGVVQGRGGGALEKMLLPFRLGVGGPVGSGRQWVSWIHLDDLLAMFVWLLENEARRCLQRERLPTRSPIASCPGRSAGCCIDRRSSRRRPSRSGSPSARWRGCCSKAST